MSVKLSPTGLSVKRCQTSEMKTEISAIRDVFGFVKVKSIWALAYRPNRVQGSVLKIDLLTFESQNYYQVS